MILNIKYGGGGRVEDKSISQCITKSFQLSFFGILQKIDETSSFTFGKTALDLLFPFIVSLLKISPKMVAFA